MRLVKYFFEQFYFFKLKQFNRKNSYPSFQLYIKYMHCGSECFCQMILQLTLIGQYLHHGPVIGLRSPVLLAAPSNLPIQVLILPGPLASAAPCAPVELNYFDGITTQMMPLV